MSIRTERISGEIRKVISERLIRGLKTPLPGFVTISSVTVSADLSVAKIFYSVFGSDAERVSATQVLEGEKYALRKEVAKKVKLRLVPELVFVLDEKPEKVSRIHEIINNLPK